MVAAAQVPVESLDSDRLGSILKALGNPVRIDLLKGLRVPKMLAEVKLHPRRRDGKLNPDRYMSRVTVREHMRQLLALGVVRQTTGTREGQTVDLYEVNHRQLFALTEELRQLALIRPVHTSDEATQVVDPAATAGPKRGPFLQLVSGIGRGTTFSLAEGTAGPDDSWRIGRKRGLEVSLDYDPYLSTVNAEIVGRNGGLAVRDMPSSRNGTTVNWEALEPGVERPLAHGDLVGVGRSLLLFRAPEG